MRTLFSILTLTVLMQTAANAGIAEITGSGIWGSTAPTTEFSAPNTTWSVDFFVSNPLPGTTDGGGDPTAPVLGGQFLFNGSPISDTIVSTTFFTTSELGGFDLYFANTTDVFSIFGPQLFSGFNLIPGTTAVIAGVNDTEDATSSGMITVSVPEPSSIIIGGLGLFSVLGVSIWRRRPIAA